ncbi:MAG: hypothetical protein ABIS23_06765 [Sphingomicrobium sp.]
MTKMMTTTAMTDRDRIVAAEIAAEMAREQFVESIQALADQLEPRRLVRELWQDAKVKGADLAEEAVDAVKSRPVAVTGVAAAIALFLAREPLAKLAGKMLSPSKDKPAARKPDKPAKPTTPTAPRRAPAKKSAAPAARTKATEKN